MTLQTGTRLGPYEIVAPIGAGGMGEVYRARDTRLVTPDGHFVIPATVQREVNPDHMKVLLECRGRR